MSQIKPSDLILVAIIPSVRDMEIARLLGWYRIPLRTAPKVIAVDYLAFKMIEEQRIKHDLRPLAKTGRYPTYIETSAKLGVGTNDPKIIERITIG